MRPRWSVWCSFIRRLRSMDFPTADRFDPTGIPRPRAVFGECHLRHPLPSYMKYYNRARTHLSLENGAALACRRTARADSLPPNSRRAAPPICPDLIFDRHRYRSRLCSVAASVRSRCARWTTRWSELIAVWIDETGHGRQYRRRQGNVRHRLELIPASRRALILERLRLRGIASINALAEELQVSASTIPRDPGV